MPLQIAPAEGLVNVLAPTNRHERSCLSSDTMHAAVGGTRVPRRIFTFWDPLPLPQIVGACISTWSHLHWNITLLTLSNVHEHGLPRPPTSTWGGEFTDDSKQRLADWYKVQAISRYGGVWLDATVIALGPHERWLDVDEMEVTGYYDPNDEGRTWADTYMQNSIFAAPPNHPLVTAWRDNLARAFEMGFDAYVESVPYEIAGGRIRKPYSAMAAAVAWRDAVHHLQLEPKQTGFRSGEDMHLERSSNVSASERISVRLRPPFRSDGPYAHKANVTMRTWMQDDSCDAAKGLFSCINEWSCAMLSNTSLIKLSAKEAIGCTSCLDQQPKNQTTLLDHKLTNHLRACSDVMRGTNLECEVPDERVWWHGLAIGIACVSTLLLIVLAVGWCLRRRLQMEAASTDEKAPLLDASKGKTGEHEC